MLTDIHKVSQNKDGSKVELCEYAVCRSHQSQNLTFTEISKHYKKKPINIET